MNRAKKFVEGLLKEADIQINGSRPWDLKVKDDRVFARVLRGGSLGFGEAYMYGWWETDALDEMLTRIFMAKLEEKVRSWKTLGFALSARILNPQRKAKAFEIGKKHYDIGNGLYRRMLDSRMVYTCGYFQNVTTLDEAQEAKLDLVCKKIGLSVSGGKKLRILDIGCGWGSFAKYAAEKYGASVVGITVSKEQVFIGREKCAGLPVELRLQDYREVNEKFDRVVSLGMFEHVGEKNFRTYMNVVNRCLKEDGLFLLHTIGKNYSTHVGDPWIEKYIFPNSMIPSANQITKSAEKIFMIEDWHNFGADYDRTLQEWWKNFSAHWDEIKNEEHLDERFYRMWKFYLKSSMATFRARRNHLWQIVFSKGNIPFRYEAIR